MVPIVNRLRYWRNIASLTMSAVSRTFEHTAACTRSILNSRDSAEPSRDVFSHETFQMRFVYDMPGTGVRFPIFPSDCGSKGRNFPCLEPSLVPDQPPPAE